MKKRIVGLITLLLFFASAPLLIAAGLGVKQHGDFVDNTPALASEVNDQFNDLYDWGQQITSTPVGINDVQTLTNKTLTTPVIASFYQDAGKTKLMTTPDTASDTLCAIAATQSLSNKTLLSPTITTSPNAAGSTWTDLGTVTTADIDGGTIDGATITSPDIQTSMVLKQTTADYTLDWDDPASARQYTFRDVGANADIDTISTRHCTPGEFKNLSWVRSVGTITISGADGTALSATNPAGVCVPSNANGGQHIWLKLTANVTFNDDDHASSDMTGWLFGVTTGVAWANYIPVFIHAINKDDTDAGLVIGFTRKASQAFTTGTANYIGDLDAVPATSHHTNLYILASITEADYTNKPAALIGAASMRKQAAADDWDFNTSSAGAGFGPDAIRHRIGNSYGMPQGQMGAESGKTFTSTDGATALAFSAVNVTEYTVDLDDYVTLHHAHSTQSVAGADGTQVRWYGPFPADITSGLENIGVGRTRLNATTSTVACYIEDANAYALCRYANSAAEGNINDSTFSNTADNIYFSIRYKY